MEFKYIHGGVCAPKGFKASGIYCGIRKNPEKKDLALVYSEYNCTSAAVYTQNLVKGAPLIVTAQNLADGHSRAIICNSGNANTCNADGIQKAQQMCEITAQALNISPNDVIVASTGVIGQVLNIEPIKNGITKLAENLRTDGNDDAAHAIMTTDTFAKQTAIEFELDGRVCRVGAMAKGSGMIHPNMATMLCFVTTDVAIKQDVLQNALKSAVDVTFNMVSVDGDTSTNDMVTVMASGAAGNAEITDSSNAAVFEKMLTLVLENLSKMIAKDGEGATRLIECRVTGAQDKVTAKTVAKSVVCSSLVKTAIFGADANWGRVMCAIGYSGAEVDITRVDLAFQSKSGRIMVCQNGSGLEFREDLAKKILLEDEIVIDIALNSGSGSATAWGCDLTYDYVKINGDYRT